MTKHARIRFDVFDHDIIKRRFVEGRTEEGDDWRLDQPAILPHILQVSVGGVSGNLQYRVPIDDHTTLRVAFLAWYAAPGFEAPHQDRTPYRCVPVYDEEGLIGAGLHHGGRRPAPRPTGAGNLGSLAAGAAREMGAVAPIQVLRSSPALLLRPPTPHRLRRRASPFRAVAAAGR